MLISIQGLIASGKTTSAHYLQLKYNAYHYNCDERVKNLYIENESLIKDVNELIIGECNLHVDVNKLRQIVFNDSHKLNQLEALVYPYVEAEIKNLKQTYELILVDGQQAHKLNLDYAAKLYISASLEIVRARVINRDKRTEHEVDAILNIQMAQKINYDYMIENNYDVDDLYQKIDMFMKELYDKTRR